MDAKRIVMIAVAGLIGAGLIAWFGFYSNLGSQIRLDGSIQKVRTLELDEHASLLVADFRLHNPADYPFVVRLVEVFVRLQDGKEIEGAVTAEDDAKRVFEFYKLLGPKYNESLVARDRIAPKATVDKMIAARFEVPKGSLDTRQDVRIRIVEVDHAPAEVRENAR